MPRHRRASFFHPRNTPNTKIHPCWCRFTFGMFPLPYNTCQTRNNTLVGVVSCSASLLWPPTHDEHERTPSLVFFQVQHLLSSVHSTMHEMTPMLMSFRAQILSCPVEWTLRGFYSIIINILYIFHSIYLIEYRACGNFVGIPHLWMRDRNFAGTGAGQPKMPHRTPVSITNQKSSRENTLGYSSCLWDINLTA